MNNWYRDHIKEFVAPALWLLENSNNQWDLEVTNFCAKGTNLDGKPIEVTKDWLEIVSLMVKDQKPILIQDDYKLIVDSVNALENRAKGKAVIFPGRDVWPFYVVMQKRKVWNDRIHYFPWMSRAGVSNPVIVRSKMEEDGITKEYLIDNCFLFDTGFHGSIFNGIYDAYRIVKSTYATKVDKLPPSGLISTNEYSTRIKCILQKNQYRSQVLRIEENLPKYFTSGDREGKQNLNPESEVLKTARLTYDLWHGVSKEKEKLKFILNTMNKLHYCEICGKEHL